MNFTMTKIAAALVLTAAATGAQAVAVATGGSFIMYNLAGYDTAGVVPGANLVNTDATMTGFVDQAAGTWGVSSTNTFFGGLWTATGGQLITAAGSYSLNTTTGIVSYAASCTVAYDGSMCFNVGVNQVAGIIDFAWGSNSGIHVVNVWNVNANGSLTTALAPGMENGPFSGFNASFNMTAPLICSLEGCDTQPLPTPIIPEPETYAMMLAGLGLVGFMARRRKQAEI